MARTFKPTHYHLGSLLPYTFIAPALALTRTPLVYRMGDCPPCQSKFHMVIWKRAMLRAARVVTNSEFVRRSAIDAGVSVNKVDLIYNFAPQSSAGGGEIVGHTLDARARRLLYVGSMSAHKGVLQLIQAFASISSRVPGLKLDLVGGSRYDAPFRHVVETRIDELGLQESVSLIGHVRNPETYYRAASALIVPSLWDEPGANVVFEAKREGTPAIVFPSGGLPEAVRHRVDGYVCNGRSPEALIEALEWMLSDTARLERMRDAAVSDFRERFDRPRFREQWIAAYAAAAARPHQAEGR
jgi:glycosyltransferase involved in cell wall biosynthesis